MHQNPIVEEIYRIRQAYARQFGYDLRALAEYLKKKERQHADRLASYPPKPADSRTSA